LTVLASTSLFHSASASAVSLLPFGISLVLRLAIIPAGILAFLRANPPANDLLPSISLPLRLTLTIAFALVARNVAHFPMLSGIPSGGAVAYVVLCGLGMLLVHRNLLAHLIGLLVLGDGIGLAAATFAPALPEFVELGAAFDALVSTVLGLTLVRSLVAHDPILDVESLRRLRG
jgi:hydrogenase-4 membrane subunit HyfE